MARKEDPVAKVLRLGPSHEGGEPEERRDISERGQEEEQAEDTRKGIPTGGENEQGRAEAKVKEPDR